MNALSHQIASATGLLLVMVAAFPPLIALAFWLRFDMPIWEAML